MTSPAGVTAIRGALVTFSGDPFVDGVEATRRYESDAVVAMAGGRIVDCGPARDVMRAAARGHAGHAYANALITAGFIDGHVHYPQLAVIGAGGKPLLDWLSDYTFPMEERYADAGHARDGRATSICAENLRNGITTAAVFCTVHPVSADVLFEEAQALDLRMIAGKVLMDRNAPARSARTRRSAATTSRRR